MKLLVLLIMLAALFLLYRIAYPKQAGMQKGDAAPNEKPKSRFDVMGKSRFVLPDRSQPLQTPAASLESDSKEDNPSTFASETEEKRSVAVPPDRMDEVFENEPNPDDLDIPPDEDEDTIDYAAEEEAEELNRVQGEVMFADGLEFDDLQQVKKVVKEQPESVNEETGRTLAALENTDMFELLVSGNEGKRDWIKAVIDRNLQDSMPETESETSGKDYSDFDIANFVS